jgi:threonine aldolase
MSEDADQPNAAADSREHQRLPRRAEFDGERGTAEQRLARLFGAGGGVFFVFTGTAANVLGLSLLLRPFEAVICAESAHLNVDECGAPERVLGAKLLTVATPDGKLTPGQKA